ncbi:hypothetical protein PUNSTDRAFT_140011 [Punctularia strigosozonata HHB-11173 SS5]|uniref:uncharacterized protein n=1 Tax=Punctularia strigosozonata (strain HHB-11173) TaxID=741275 RepID=UPI0004417966|nr:uncharacterized protein PUNSTDRAFT_140011 [Punctularia strigosozonata HHB-11173 SS5]EIN13483.1 hypothetical protein PUNSTDRAFT_140011 [Punctularia strigosozonata HHB-11173 SS5]
MMLLSPSHRRRSRSANPDMFSENEIASWTYAFDDPRDPPRRLGKVAHVAKRSNGREDMDHTRRMKSRKISLEMPRPPLHRRRQSFTSSSTRTPLPFRSADFNLQRMSASHCPSANPHLTNDAGISSLTEFDLLRMRCEAFDELHKAVIDSEEGLVKRMREMEGTRSRPGPYAYAKELREQRRSRSETRRTQDAAGEEDEGGDDEDVVFIGDTSLVSDPTSASSNAHESSPDAMELDPPDVGAAHTAVSYDPRASPGSLSTSPASSAVLTPAVRLPSDDTLDPSISALSLPPSIAPPHPNPATQNKTHRGGSPDGILPPSIASPGPTASRADKALAAITLALASGAGGLNDYTPLQSVSSQRDTAEGDAGELWH